MVRKGVACDECTNNCEILHQKSKDVSSDVSRFFKVMFGKDFQKVLYLPPEFARTVKHLAGQETQIEDSSGMQWSVAFSCINGSLAIQRGWNKFSVDHGLEEGQFLVFNYIKGGHFVVQIYGKSACEKIDFEKGGHRRSKRLRVSPETVSLDEPFQAVDVNSSKKPSPADSVASRSENRDGETNVVETNAKSRKLNIPMSIDVEDLTCMINRDDGCYQREDNNILYDLSCFEMENRTPEINKFEKGHFATGITEQTKTKGDDIQMVEINENEINGHCNDMLTETFDKGLGAKVDSSHADKTGQSKVNGDGPKMAASANQINGNNPGEIFVDKFQKASNTKITSSQSVKTHQNKMKGDDTKTTAVDTNPIAVKSGEIFVDKFKKASGTKRTPSPTIETGRNKRNVDISRDKFRFKRPDNRKLSKKVQDIVSNSQNGDNNHQASDSESPLKDRSKIDMKEFSVNHARPESSVSSSVLKKPFGHRPIKNERVELNEEGKGFPEVFFEKKPVIITDHSQTFSPPPVVKVEPDLPDYMEPSVAISPFSAEVKSQTYLELPLHIPVTPGRRERGRGKVVYLRDPTGRLWPILNPDVFAVKALTDNWTRFCEENGIKPGDECRFQAEDQKACLYRVDVTHKEGD